MQGTNDFGALPPPPVPPVPPAPAGFEDRRYREELASKRLWLIVAGVSNAVAGILFRAGSLPPGVSLLIVLVVGIFVIVATFRLAKQLYNTAAGVLCAILMLVPVVYIGVVVFLAVQSAKRLRTPAPPAHWSGPSPSGFGS